MLSLLAGLGVPLGPREKNNLPGPMIYSARDAPGPMIIDTKFSSVVPLATLDDDFVAKAEEATRAAAAAIKSFDTTGMLNSSGLRLFLGGCAVCVRVRRCA